MVQRKPIIDKYRRERIEFNKSKLLTDIRQRKGIELSKINARIARITLLPEEDEIDKECKEQLLKSQLIELENATIKWDAEINSVNKNMCFEREGSYQPRISMITSPATIVPTPILTLETLPAEVSKVAEKYIAELSGSNKVKAKLEALVKPPETADEDELDIYNFLYKKYTDKLASTTYESKMAVAKAFQDVADIISNAPIKIANKVEAKYNPALRSSVLLQWMKANPNKTAPEIAKLIGFPGGSEQMSQKLSKLKPKIDFVKGSSPYQWFVVENENS